MYIMISKGPKRSETPVWNPWHFSLHPTHYNLKKKKTELSVSLFPFLWCEPSKGRTSLTELALHLPMCLTNHDLTDKNNRRQS